MKTRFISFAVLAIVATALFSCAKVNEQESLFNEQKDIELNEGTPFELIAGTIDTKTTNDDMSTKWASTDKINVFYAASGSSEYTSAGQFSSTGTGSNVTFTGTVGALNDNNDWYAFYPYNSNITTPNNTGTYYTAVGGAQTWASGASATAHLAGTKFPVCGRAMNVAKATTPTIEMKPAMSLVKIHVTNNGGAALNVKSVTFATEDYPINGQFYIAFKDADPTFTPKDGGTGKSSTLTVEGGYNIAVSGTADFYIGVAPFTAVSGKKLIVTVNGYSKELILSSTATFAPGKIKTLNFNYSETISQADLPFSLSGAETAANYNDKDGLSYWGVIPQGYAAGNAPYRAQWKTDGGYLQVYYNQPAAKVSMGVKMIGGANTTYFDIKGSTDGVSYAQIERFTVSGAQNDIHSFETTAAIDPDYRYIRIVFAKGASGSNVGVGAITISKPSTAPEIQANNITGVSVTGATSTFSYTIKNFASADDVSVKSVDGSVVTSASVTSAGTVSYTVAPNYDTGSANGTITLTSANEGIDKVVNVTQVGETFSTTATATITLAKDASSGTFTITTPSFGWASIVTPETGMNLTIDPASGSANASAQTITINTTTAATASEQTLGTIVIYRNGNSTDTQKKTITIKKAANAAGVSWVETALGDLTSSDEFVIVGNGRSMSNGNGTSSAPTAASVTITAGAITSAVTDAITWHLDGNSTDGYTFYPKGTTEKWLYCNTTASSGSNNNMRVGTGSRKVFNLETKSSKNYLITSDTYTKRYVCVYNSADWRGYVESSIVTTDTKFYKKVTE